jgi:hypothetical protein
MKGLEQASVNAGGRRYSGDPGEGGLAAGKEGEAAGRSDPGKGYSLGPFLLVGRVDERIATGRGPSFRLPVPLGETRPDIPDAQLGGGRRDLGKEGQVGADGFPVLPKNDGVEPDRDSQGSAGECGQSGELGQGLAEGRNAGLGLRPAEPRDREMAIDLVVAPEQVLQPVRVPEEVRKILRPEDDRMDVRGGKVDVVDAAGGTGDPGQSPAEGGGEPVRERGDEVRAPGGADDGFQGLIPVRGRADRPTSRRGKT